MEREREREGGREEIGGMSKRLIRQAIEKNGKSYAEG